MHFDNRLSERRRARQFDFSNELKKHQFYPLLGYLKQSRRVKRNEAGAPVASVKDRPIKFASHGDSAYLEAYAAYLSLPYEHDLRNAGLHSSILAYRKGNRSNIHHAKDLFDEIASRGDCLIVAVDISGFFDNLLHDHLKYELSSLLATPVLTGHHWTIFKALTRYSWVDVAALDEALGVERKKAGRVCTPEQYISTVRSKKRGLVQVNGTGLGIPQGTPISGLYANIYMRSLDRRLLEYAVDLGGSYRRYSDDIAVVLPVSSDATAALSGIRNALSAYGLELSEGKTELTQFLDGRCANPHRPVQYLGFTYDGTRVQIRTSSMLRYQKKMRQGIRAKLVAAKAKEIPSDRVYRRQLLSRYTHLGKGRNYIKYVYRASDIFGDPHIRLQVKKHQLWFNRLWRKEVERVYGGLISSE